MNVFILLVQPSGTRKFQDERQKICRTHWSKGVKMIATASKGAVLGMPFVSLRKYETAERTDPV